jgi:hypothetical protein
MSKGGAIGLEGSKTWRRRGENGSDSKVFSAERMIVKMGGPVCRSPEETFRKPCVSGEALVKHPKNLPVAGLFRILFAKKRFFRNGNFCRKGRGEDPGEDSLRGIEMD